MANNIEIVNLNQVQEEVTVGIGSQQTQQDIYTYYFVQPPLSETEHETLIEKLGPENKVGQLLVAGLEKKDEWLRLNVEGGLNQEHVDLGIELASEVIALRGVRSGRVMAIVEEEFQNYWLYNKDSSRPEDEDPTVIDYDEFEEAQRDPKFIAFARRAREYGAAQAERNRQIESEGKVQLVEATEGTAVLRSPTTGGLYGISLDVGSDGEEAHVTDLEDLADIELIRQRMASPRENDLDIEDLAHEFGIKPEDIEQ